MSVDGHMGDGIDQVLGEGIAVLHQRVEVVSRRVHGQPARLVVWVWSVKAADCANETGVWVLGVAPQFVGPHVGGVEVRLGWVEDHAMYGRCGRVVVVLDVFFQRAGAVDAEDVAMPGVVVEGVAVDVEGRLLSGEEEYGAGLGVD